MFPSLPEPISVSLPVIRVATTSDSLSLSCCLRCRVSLDVHQPDPAFPGRLLSTCGRCGSWYLLDGMSYSEQTALVSLPGEGFFLAALREHAS